MFHFKHIITLVLSIFALSACGVEFIEPLDEGILEAHGVKSSEIELSEACAKLDESTDMNDISDLFSECNQESFEESDDEELEVEAEVVEEIEENPHSHEGHNCGAKAGEGLFSTNNGDTEFEEEENEVLACGDPTGFSHICAKCERKLIEDAWKSAIKEYEKNKAYEPLGKGWPGNLPGGGGADCDVVANRLGPLLFKHTKRLAAERRVLIDEIDVETVVLEGWYLNHQYFIMVDASGKKIAAADPWRDAAYKYFGADSSQNSWTGHKVTRSSLDLDKASQAAEQNAGCGSIQER